MVPGLSESTETEIFAVLCRRYGVSAPPERVRSRYLAWAESEPAIGSAVERLLLTAVSWGRIGAWMASAYAARFARSCPLRRRETALLGFLECEPDCVRTIDGSSGCGPAGAWLRFTWWGGVEAVGLLFGMLIFGPVHLLGGRP